MLQQFGDALLVDNAYRTRQAALHYFVAGSSECVIKLSVMQSKEGKKNMCTKQKQGCESMAVSLTLIPCEVVNFAMLNKTTSCDKTHGC